MAPWRIAAAAIALVDEQGPHALSFRTLGDRLGVSHMTIHRRCGDLGGLLDLCADHLAAELPGIPLDADWAEATEARFRRFYELLVAHPGLVALRGSRPWLGQQILARLVEPSLAHSIAAGMTPRHATEAYRRMYLLTLGCASFVNHRDPKAAGSATRAGLAALDPQEFPVLAGHLQEVVPVVTDHEVYNGALRQLIAAAQP
ncbi:TetR/AcrR family transcriptional regulator [Streptomyces ehimensis]|uniref:TetR/AcrR family transcriptional regulator n=1 Tax=Streptomyces ehimensis TaxID=68195 RepID=A0ABV9BTU3_9ACTN